MTELEARLLRENQILKEENRLLRQKVDLLVRRVFGSSSEKTDPNQLQLGLGLELPGGEPEASPSAIDVEAKPARKANKPRRPRFPDDIRVEERILIPPEVEDAPESWRKIGEEISQQMDYQPGHFFCKRIIRPTCVSRLRADEAPITAELPERLIEKGLYASGLLAHIIVSKYADHLPLDRQEKIFKQRYGVEIPKQSMSRACEQVADGLQLVVEEMKRQQFESGAVQVDETPIRYLAPGEGKTRKGYLWATHVPGGDTIYHWGPGRSTACLEAIIPESFAGTLQTDGYGVYGSYKNRHADITLAGCWAHARRKFYEALQDNDHPLLSSWVIRQIQLLYEIEQRLRESRAGPALREAVRNSESIPILHRIQKGLEAFQKRSSVKPKRRLGMAVSYTLGQWNELTSPFEDGRLEIDNNLVENAIRPTAVGKKNWLFIGAEDAGRKSAILYSLITSCRNHGVEPYAYLKYLIETLPTLTNQQLAEVTPSAYAKRHQRKAA